MLITSLVALTVTAATPVVPKQYATVEGLTSIACQMGCVSCWCLTTRSRAPPST